MTEILNFPKPRDIAFALGELVDTLEDPVFIAAQDAWMDDIVKTTSAQSDLKQCPKQFGRPEIRLNECGRSFLVGS